MIKERNELQQRLMAAKETMAAQEEELHAKQSRYNNALLVGHYSVYYDVSLQGI